MHKELSPPGMLNFSCALAGSSARETFDWSEMCNVRIPIPPIRIQKAVAEVFAVYKLRKKINEQLKAQIKDICPILIKGSLEEGKAV